MASPYAASTIGVHAHWQCSHCGQEATSDQIVTAGDHIHLAPPHGWTIYEQHSICDRHVVIIAVQQKAA